MPSQCREKRFAHEQVVAPIVVDVGGRDGMPEER